MLKLTFKTRIGLAPSYLAELLNDFVPVRALRSSDSPALAVPHFKLKTVGDRSFCSVGPRMWNSLPHSLRAGILACVDATPGTVTSKIRSFLLATHFDGLSHDSTSRPSSAA